MTSPPASSEVLYRKPGTITAAQTFMWLQFSFLVCCGTGGAFAVLFAAGVIAEVGIGEDVVESVENTAVLIVSVVAGVVALSILFGVLAAKIGAGRRWAQGMTITLMLAGIVFGFVGLSTGFELRESAGAPVDGSSVVGALLTIAMPVATLICLCTGSANQWFRQGGRDSWPKWTPGAYPYPYPPRY